MGIKETVKDWAWETWDEYVKNPIAKKTEELENEAVKHWKLFSESQRDCLETGGLLPEAGKFLLGFVLDLCWFVVDFVDY